MDFNKVISNRTNTFTWDYTKEVDVQLIKDAMYDNYMKAPTKNLKYPFVIKVIKNNNLDRRKEIMSICHRNDDMGVETDLGNPQVLAPYLIGFCQRNVLDVEVLYQRYTRNSESVIRYDHVEFGIQATYLMLGLQSRGLNTGITQNCSHNPDRVAELFGVDQPVRLILGVGYASNELEYLDPRTNSIKSVPYDRKNIDIVYPRPAFNEVYKVEK
jgi:hypothetical protein|tara:strand:+ start:460 stop:1101 length:642 start_codon:yes stop_codon:yes gene_type:complete